ncbi:MAG TPA: cysteine peptidase family C39 domain-containing protein [Acetobacteraceae bacterium]|nr:cysteine peptidase family C39 domain-containing protein [Acetobacteraceae bacterium]
MPRVPLVLQHDAAECGAACLAMILGFHGTHAPLDELRMRCGVSRNGSRASSIIAAAKTYGLSGRGLRCEPEALCELPRPCILFWNFNHFVVLDRFDRQRRAHLLDPALGRRTAEPAEIDKAFTGVCLSFTPDRQFVATGSRPGLWSMLRERLVGTGHAFRLLTAFAVMAALPVMLMPSLSRIFVDDVLLRTQWRWLNALVAITVATATFQMISIAFRRKLLVAVESWTITSGEARFLAHLLSLPLSFFSQRHTGELIDRLGAFTRFANTLAGPLADGISGAITATMLLLAALIVDPLTGLTIFVFAAIAFAAAWSAGRMITARTAFARRAESMLASATLEGVRLIDAARAAGRSADAFANWSGHHARAASQRTATLGAQLRLQTAPRVATGLLSVGVIAVAGWRAMDGVIGIGQIVALQMLAGALVKPLGDLTTVFLAAPDIKADVARVDDVFRYGTDALPRRPSSARPVGRLEFRDVTFGYARAEPPIVRNVSFIVEPGRRVALAGRSGSGKSSLAKLAAGLYVPWSGEVTIDGVPVASLSPVERAALIGYVDQSIVLFEGSVRENLALFRPEMTHLRATQALRDVAMLAEIEARPGGLDAQVSEFGGNFSGGQRQRLEIARALAGAPLALVLDEATSALDPLVEAEIEANLRRRGTTSLLIAHRLSTIRDADEILVLDHGEVVERGRHAALLALHGHYHALASGE